ncbi:MAG TPA: hypothetical protein ENK91_15345 [Bacteroidetes bacterium]|nr:hypothetical protein [Bacteroidota bacterium]
MDNREFDDIIKKEMDRTREFEFKDSLWDDLENKLINAGKVKPVINYWKWFSMLLIVLLLLSTSYLFYNINNDNKTNIITKDNNKIDEKASVNRYINKTIYKYDTIIKTITKTITNTRYNYRSNYNYFTNSLYIPNTYRLGFSSIKENRTFLNSLNSQEGINSYTYNNDYIQKPVLKTYNKRIIVNDKNDDRKTKEEITKEFVDNKPANLPDSNTQQELENDYFKKIFEQVNQDKEKESGFIQNMTNEFHYNGLGIGVEGVANYVILASKYYTIKPGIGVRLELFLGEHIKVSNSITGSFIQFNFDDFNPDLGIPIISPPIAGQTLSQIELNRYLYLDKLYLDWKILNHNNFTLFAGAGYSVGFYTVKNLDYAFQIDGEGNDIHVLNQLENSEEFIHGPFVNIDLDYYLFNDLYFNINGNYFIYQNKPNSIPYLNWNSSVSIIYKINRKK